MLAATACGARYLRRFWNGRLPPLNLTPTCLVIRFKVWSGWSVICVHYFATCISALPHAERVPAWTGLQEECCMLDGVDEHQMNQE
jgi:hypothetical protein